MCMHMCIAFSTNIVYARFKVTNINVIYRAGVIGISFASVTRIYSFLDEYL